MGCRSRVIAYGRDVGRGTWDVGRGTYLSEWRAPKIHTTSLATCGCSSCSPVPPLPVSELGLETEWGLSFPLCLCPPWTEGDAVVRVVCGLLYCVCPWEWEWEGDNLRTVVRRGELLFGDTYTGAVGFPITLSPPVTGEDCSGVVGEGDPLT
jgi:hypothetical protein